jgi:hypothetical protein
MSLRFNSLLVDEGIDPAEVRLLRHETRKVPGRTPYTIWRDDPAAFDEYQTVQNTFQRSRLEGRYWASFVVPPGGPAMFVGLYQAKHIGPASPDETCPLSLTRVGEGNDKYECRRLPVLGDFGGRILIDWGPAERVRVQRADTQNKAIVELRRTFQEEAFPGFTRLTRSLSEIETMPAAWKETLRASRGIYLLACPRTREHYVGSAYGEDGFLGRWRAYVGSGHGGNLGLKIREPSDYLVSVLEVAGSSATVEEIISLEVNWKLKLQSRDIGLNRN